MTNTTHTLQEKTTAMEKAIRMAKEVHEAPERPTAINFRSISDAAYDSNLAPPARYQLILDTAKQIYDWLTA